MRFIGELSELQQAIQSAGFVAQNPNLCFAPSGSSFPSEVSLNHRILVGHSTDEIRIIQQLRALNGGHFVQSDHLDVLNEVRIADALSVRGDDLFQQAEKLLLPTATSCQYDFSASDAKKATLKQIRSQVQALPGSKNILDKVQVICDEMYMNALFDAPVDSGGRHVNESVARSESVSIDVSTPARLTVTHTDQWLVLVCMDPFGSLNIKLLLERLTDNYAHGGQAEVREDESKGAGVGVRMIFEYSTSLYIGVDIGKSTVFAAKLPLRKSARVAESMPKNLHIIECQRTVGNKRKS